jgi:ribulose kinase
MHGQVSAVSQVFVLGGAACNNRFLQRLCCSCAICCIVCCRRGVWVAWAVVAAGAAVGVVVAARGAASPAMRTSQSLIPRATLSQVSLQDTGRLAVLQRTVGECTSLQAAVVTVISFC